MQVSLWRKLNAHRDHRWAQSRMSLYIDDELSDRQSRRLAAHEEICPDCNRVVRTLRGMIAALRGSRGPQAPDPALVAERVSAEIARQAPE